VSIDDASVQADVAAMLAELAAHVAWRCHPGQFASRPMEQALETAGQQVGLNKQRTAWIDEFRSICEQIDWTALLEIDPAVETAIAQVNAERNRLTDTNVRTSLFFKHSGSKGPLFLRRHIFSHSTHPLNWEVILQALRQPVEQFLRERVQQLIEGVIGRLTSEHVQAQQVRAPCICITHIRRTTSLSLSADCCCLVASRCAASACVCRCVLGRGSADAVFVRAECGEDSH